MSLTLRAATPADMTGGAAIDDHDVLSLHRRAGFADAGRLERVGRKVDRWPGTPLCIRGGLTRAWAKPVVREPAACCASAAA
ncbi:hypothetical protein ACQFYA_12830 [Promicromonospora sp. Marseille-Q5078]